jgi:alkylation response protein AidB-like acyl-CoA dehydrogenase
MPNPLLNDRDVTFLLYEVLGVESLCELPYYSEHSRETFDLYLDACRKLAREQLFPSYRSIDEQPPTLVNGRVKVHPRMHALFKGLSDLGVVNATRPETVGGQQLPFTLFSLGGAYLSAANLSAYGYVGLSSGAARLLESFGSEQLKQDYMAPIYRGEWTGTMALTEPQAGSSLSDVKTRATAQADGSYKLVGSKIFISGGDQDLTDNIVHMTLARIDGSPAGVKGISLFAVPARRLEQGALVSNDTSTAGVIHKIGWRGLPSIALNLGENGDCQGYLVGQPNQGLAYMFQMMNEARLMVGMQSVATAYVAYQEALEYAKTRPQGRTAAGKQPDAPQVPIVEHADVRRMLLRQKAIVEGGLALLGYTAHCSDLAEHASSKEQRQRAQLLLELLTPIAKTFPAERGFEANALAVQVHGGYGYSSEYLPEAWLRDQKLNSIHEGTTGIQGLDLLGRKVSMLGGAALELFAQEVRAAIAAAREAEVDARWTDELGRALELTLALTKHLLGLSDVQARLLHSADYLELFSTLSVGFVWLLQATAAQRGLRQLSKGTVQRAGGSGRADEAFYRGKLAAAQYWIMTDVPRVEHLARLCRDGEDSYRGLSPEWL